MEEDVYHDPPARMMRCLRWFCADHFLEEVEGDLYEYFQEEVEVYGLKRARRRFAFLAIRYFRPYFFAKEHLIVNLLINAEMIRHFAKIAFRQLRRQKFYALINILGFGVGLAACLLIGLFVQHESHYDEYHTKANELYRLSVRYEVGSNSGQSAVMSPPMAGHMKAAVPEVVESARLAPEMYDAGSNQVRPVEELANRYESGFCYADASFLTMFDLPLVQGTAAGQLEEPNTMLITEKKARLLFGNSNPVGQQLILNDEAESTYRITGILADLPGNTHLQFDYLLSMEGNASSKQDNWNFNNFLTYVELTPGADVAKVEAAFLAEMKTADPSLNELLDNGGKLEPVLEAVPSIHLHTSETFGYWQQGNGQYVRIFSLIALFILLLASINFINLSTARARLRGLEIGLRKVLGSLRQQLVAQFLVESVIVSGLALLLAVAISGLSLPFFNALTERQLSLPWGQWWWYAGLLLAPLVLGLVVGAYPALYLSGYDPIQVLKGYLSRGAGASKFRSQLVVFQFTIAIALIAGSLAVKQQLDFLQEQELGYNKEQVLIVEGSHIMGEQADLFKAKLQELNRVEQVSQGGFLPVDGYFRNGCGTWITGQQDEEHSAGLQKWYVDHDYLATMGMEIIDGRAFSAEMASDSLAIILSETAVKDLNLSDPVGSRVSSSTYMDQETGEIYHEDYVVIGVVKDFHFESLRTDIRGLSLVIGDGTVNTMIRYQGADTKAVMDEVSEVWSVLAPDQPIRLSFLDEQYANMYRFEERLGKVFSLFTGLAILVACLGLFALATFMAQQRQREIGVRKVLGASTKDIVLLLTRPFTLLVVIAIVVALPLAWWATQRWLSDFAYHADISLWNFALAGGLALLLAVLTMSYQALKAAVTDPVDTIR